MKTTPLTGLLPCLLAGVLVGCGPSYSQKKVVVRNGGLIETPGRDLLVREIGRDTATISIAPKDVIPPYGAGRWTLREKDDFSVGNGVSVHLEKLHRPNPGDAEFRVMNLERHSWLVPPP